MLNLINSIVGFFFNWKAPEVEVIPMEDQFPSGNYRLYPCLPGQEVRVAITHAYMAAGKRLQSRIEYEHDNVVDKYMLEIKCVYPEKVQYTKNQVEAQYNNSNAIIALQAVSDRAYHITNTVEA